MQHRQLDIPAPGPHPQKWYDWILAPRRFEGDAEADYLYRWRLSQALRLQWLSGWTGTAMYIAALLADRLLGDRMHDPLLFWSFGAVGVAMTLTLSLATRHPKLSQRAYDVAFWTLLVNGTALIAVTAATRQSGNPFPLEWTLVLLIYTFVSTGMPYRRCVPLGIGLGVLDVVVAISERLPALELADHLLLIIAVIVTGIIACATLERSDRLGWMRARLMQAQSYSDELTGLRNRRYLFEEGAHRIEHAGHEDQPIALLMVDVDHFKRYNDALGHPVGDLCLRQISEALPTATQHPLDIAARLGGEEFAVLLFACDRRAALNAAERLRSEIETRAILHPSAPCGCVTVSIGIAASTTESWPDSLDSLLLTADKALYRAKESGRNLISA